MSAELPGSPGPTLTAVWDALNDVQKEALLPHLLGGTSAERLALLLSNNGRRIGATSIKSYRRSLAARSV